MGSTYADSCSCCLHQIVFVIGFADQASNGAHATFDEAKHRAVSLSILVKFVVFNFELAVSAKRDDRLITKAHLQCAFVAYKQGIATLNC